jgi:hypothetical protein
VKKKKAAKPFAGKRKEEIDAREKDTRREKQNTATKAERKKPPVPRTRRTIEKRMREILLELMRDDLSGSVRLGAIRELRELLALKDRMTAAAGRDGQRNELEERAAAIADARAILAEFAEAKAGSVARAGEVDQDGAAGAADSER